MPWDKIRFDSPLGNVLVDNFTIVTDEVVRDVAVDRPPYSTDYFLTGTLQETGRLTISVRPKKILGYDAHKQLDDLANILNRVTRVVWNGRTRQTFGADGNITITPTEKTFNITFTLPCTSDWTRFEGNVISFDDCLPITPAPTNETAYSFGGSYPDETFSFSRRIEVIEGAVRQRGDLMQNASSVVIPLTVATGNDADTWATALHVTSLARNIQAIISNELERPVLSWSRINRKYRGCVIDLTLEFFMAARMYSYGPRLFLFSDDSGVQFSDDTLAIGG